MAERLKDSLGPDIPRRIADAVADTWRPFDRDAFLRDALDGYDPLELTQRARHIARALRSHLPADYEAALAILMASLGPRDGADRPTGMATFYYAPHVYFVADNGLESWERSMEAQHELTQRFTAEYSIRAFLEREPERTLDRLRQWASDPSEDVRRLVSEGTRPRLPWAPRLRRFQENPAPILELLELLRDDPSLYVRRSVANNLNDIGKDHPELLVETCRRWLIDAPPERRWVIGHALRSAVKRGDQAALTVLGFDGDRMASVTTVRIEPDVARIGESVRVSFAVVNDRQTRAAFNADLRVRFVKANGAASPKVFKVGRLDLAPGERAVLRKQISLRQQTTRTHYPGEHGLEVLINGRAHSIGAFMLEPARAPGGDQPGGGGPNLVGSK